MADVYYDIRQGIGFNKTPEVYGAFPTDPYSHTPAGQGAKQPGMTGQVKEEILTRLGEMGAFVEQGCLSFRPVLLREREFTDRATVFNYVDVAGQRRAIELPAGSLAYTLCQVPVVYVSSIKVYAKAVTITVRVMVASTCTGVGSLHSNRLIESVAWASTSYIEYVLPSSSNIL